MIAVVAETVSARQAIFIYLSADEEMVMMKVSRFWFGAAVLAMAVFTSVALASGHGDARPMKKGILLVAFGSSEASAQVSFENIDKKVKEAYPGIPVRWAYTSHIIRAKLAQQGRGDCPGVVRTV